MTAEAIVPIVLGPPTTLELTSCGIESHDDPTRHPPYEPVFRTLDHLAVGETVRLAVGHDPEPMLEALDAARPGQFVWEPLLQGPTRWVGVLRRPRYDEQPAPVRRLSPLLARRVGTTNARNRLAGELRSIAIDLLGPSDPHTLAPEATTWVEQAADEAVLAIGDLSLAQLVERLDAILERAPTAVAGRLNAAADRQEAGVF